MKLYITENQFNRVILNNSVTEKKKFSSDIKTIAENFSHNDKAFLLALSLALYPSLEETFNHFINESEFLLESKWYNTLLDVIGIIDPTGAANSVNAISYFNQGDTFFGILSLVAAVPYIGDVVVMPIMGALKTMPAQKAIINTAIATKDTSKLVNIFTKIRNMPVIGPLIEKFLNFFPKIMLSASGILKKMTEKLASGGMITRVTSKPIRYMISKITRYLDDIFNFFKTGFSKLPKSSIKTMGKNSKLLKSGGKSKISVAEKDSFKKLFRQKVGGISIPFTGWLRKSGQNWKILQVPAGRVMLNKSLFLGGLISSVFPDSKAKTIEELNAQYGEDTVTNKMSEFGNTPEGSKLLDQDFGDTYDGSTPFGAGNMFGGNEMDVSSLLSMLK